MANEPTTVGNLSLGYLEGLYADYLRDATSVPPEWRHHFAELARCEPVEKPPGLGPAFGVPCVPNPLSTRGGLRHREELKRETSQENVDALIRSYRSRGHIVAEVDPLQQPRSQPPELDPAYHGLTSADMDREFGCATLEPDRLLTLGEIIERLRNTYCRSIGVQFMHIDDYGTRQWLQERMERTQNRLQIGRDEQIRILTRLTDAVVFEEFIRRKFTGAKSFSLEGSESLIPLLDLAIERASEQGVGEIVMAMAHRGRLNVLANIIGKSPREIFREFEDAEPERYFGGGDVKYHQGYSNDWVTAAGRKVHLTLCFNPSHLEFVNPVAAGRVRCRQDATGDTERTRTLLVLIHGDAAFIGEGVTQETLNLSRLAAYTVGGALHVIINNQIGFTTPPPQGRSSMYATSVAKMLPAPIFHVNGENPEAVAQCLQLALDFRQKFRLDVVIDMYGYRRLGHNESDEPTFTQPVLYRRIAQRKPVREGYLEHLLALAEVTREEADEIAERRRRLLEQNLAEARSLPPTQLTRAQPPAWLGYFGGPESAAEEVDTGVDKTTVATLLEAQTRLPADFHPHPKIARAIKARLEMARGERPLDWSAAESLAFASLAAAGVRVRMSGQDCERGTFGHRHAVLHDYEDGRSYTPLQHLSPNQAPVEIYNSPLSETGVLGFEFGWSLDCPNSLVLWEAQFGDFVNVAQVILDQFVASGEKKWGLLSGLTLLLPHGLEGMGPEHSNARPGRFLLLAADDNFQLVWPTTPAQYFHCLRRQGLRRWRKPMVVLTPKSLLRHPQAVSSLDELAAGRFQRILPDARNKPAAEIKRVLLCSGKIYFELAEKREKTKRDDVAILRLEQLYPLPPELLKSALAGYGEGTPTVWVQEEPENMGGWRYFRARFGETLFGRLSFHLVSRPASASPETGSANAHKLEQAKVIAQAFGELS